MRVWSWIVALALVSSCVDEEAGGVSQGDGFDDVRGDGNSQLVHVIHDFSDRDLYPEGGAFDPVDRAFYVGSLRHGNITRVAADGSESILFAGEGGDDGRLTLGMQVDAP